MEKKLTDGDIIQAYFHDCKKRSCETCPLGSIENCMEYVEDLIKRLQAENERLNDIEFTKEHCDLYSENGFLHNALRKKNEEIERLTEERNKYKDLYTTMYRKYSDLTHKEFNFNTLMKQKDEYLDKALELQKQVDEWNSAFIPTRVCQQAVKDTAKEILQKLYNMRDVYLQSVEYEIRLQPNNFEELCERYGVEV